MEGSRSVEEVRVVAAYERMMGVLSAFSIDTPRLTLSEIARATGLPVSTTHRLLEDLVAWGILEKDEQKLYVVGRRLWRLGSLSPHVYRQRTSVMPLLERLFITARMETVLLVLDDDGALVIEQLLGWRESRSTAGVGERLPLHATSPGLIALAFGPSSLWARTVREPLRRFTTNTIVSVSALRRAVDRVRREGVAATNGTLVLGTSSVSAPVFDADGELYGAVSVVSTSARNEDARAASPRVAATARSISAALHSGAQPGLPHPIVATRRHISAVGSQ